MARRGRLPAGAGLGGLGRHTEKAPEGLVLARAPAPISCPAESPGAPHPCPRVRESSSSICPASRDECRGLCIPPTVTAAGMDVPQCSWGWRAGPGWPCPVCRQQGGRAQHEGTWALHSRVSFAAPGAPCQEHGWQRPPGHRTHPALPQPQLTTHAAAAPGSASGKRSCQIRRC